MKFSILRRKFSFLTSKTQIQSSLLPKKMENQESGTDDPAPFSVLKGKEFSVSKILSRDSSVGQSSRISYYRTTANEGVPFKWERQPGTPKNPPLEEVIPPPVPPPAAQSLALPRPKVVHDDDSEDSPSWLFWFWKKRLSKMIMLQTHGRRSIERGRQTRFSNMGNGNKVVSNSDGDSDAEFGGWVHRDSKSSSYSSSSSSSGLPSDQPGRLRRGMAFGCSPWRIS